MGAGEGHGSASGTADSHANGSGPSNAQASISATAGGGGGGTSSSGVIGNSATGKFKDCISMHFAVFHEIWTKVKIKKKYYFEIKQWS